MGWLALGIGIGVVVGWFLANLCRISSESEKIHDDAAERKFFSDN